jgi:anti-sigma28 factor (negative regulator of flagellin synthesis)
MSPERRERLMQLKKSIEEGTYKIDTDKIAARMMRDIERDE